MRKRVIQISGFLISSLGWLFVLCTMAMDYWRITKLGGQGGSYIIKVAWYWSNLWSDCYTDSAAVTNCREYPVLWNVALCCFVGMECTYIGGSDKTKDKVLFAGAVLHFVGGMSDIAAYCLYINRIARTAFARKVASGVLRYELGSPVFLGLAGGFFILVGAVLYAVTVYKVIRRKSRVVQACDAHTYMAPPSRGRTIYSGYYKPSKLYGSNYMGSGRSSAQLSKLQATPTKPSDRDAFV
ncbi:claudin-10 isoform X2 [Maylandia zebra]|uniref:claudin-10 isoform X2 n=1 Tax=Simochromis diagramma TaxID=43689 RepID=UPI001A7E32FD|nr:claudin-10 isoform X2 [Simochromis diagramma]